MKNWKKYSFEFLSIFIAVISAFALSNWNDNRKSHHAESKILTEIYIGLEKDLNDIHLNVLGHESGIEATRYFHDLLEGKPIPADSIPYHYFNLTRDFISVQNTSGYETLKSRGLELIEDDSLRTKIISLYEYDYNTLRKLEEEYYELQFHENYFHEINRIIAPNLTFDKNNKISGVKTPLEITAEEKKLLLSYLWRIRVNRVFILQYAADVEKKIKLIRSSLEEVIEQ